MPEKTVAILSKDPELKRLAEQRDERRTFVSKQLDNLKKQFEDTIEEAKEAEKRADREMIELLQKRGEMSDFDEKKHCFHCDLDEDRVYYHDQDDHRSMHPIQAFMMNLTPRD